MKSKFPFKDLSKLTLKNYKAEIKKELRRLEVETEPTQMVLLGQYRFACGAVGALVIPGDFAGDLKNFYVEQKAARKSNEKDFAKAECLIEKDAKGGTLLKISLTDGPLKPSVLNKGLKATKIAIKASITGNGESLAVSQEEEEENPLLKKTDAVAAPTANLEADLEKVRAGFTQVREAIVRITTGQASAADKAALVELQGQIQRWMQAFANAAPEQQARYKDQADKLKEQYAKVAGLINKAGGEPATAQPTLTGSVGKGGDNKPADVKLVQQQLIRLGAKITADGDCGPRTLAAIEAFQRAKFGAADGRIDPNGKSWKALLTTNGNGAQNNQNQQNNQTNPQQGGKPEEPSWVKIARGELGVTEIEGAKNNQRIIDYHSTTGKFSDDETPWCSSFVNWVMQKDGKGGTGNAMALSWAKWGKNVGKPAMGAIAVFSYGGGKGHVGFVVGKKGSNLLILGGNQGNKVSESAFGTGKIVAYIFPSNYEVPANAYALGESNGDFKEADFNSTR